MKKTKFLSILFFAVFTFPFLTSCGDDNDDPIVEPTKSDAELLTESYTKVVNNIVGIWQEEAYSSFTSWIKTSSQVEKWTFNSDGTAYEECVSDVATNKMVDGINTHWKYSVVKDTSIDMTKSTEERTAWNGKYSDMYYPYSTGAVVLKLNCLDYEDSDKEYFVEIRDNGKMYTYDTQSYGGPNETFGFGNRVFAKK